MNLEDLKKANELVAEINRMKDLCIISHYPYITVESGSYTCTTDDEELKCLLEQFAKEKIKKIENQIKKL